ncbi:MAG: ATP12 family protein [Hyphomicrobiales bacterium]|nr:ATP12 family protein [Hyphomicrobiales bacterium]
MKANGRDEGVRTLFAAGKPLRRFYETVSVEAAEGGWRVLLDGKTVKTPARANLTFPTAALAERIAAEWRAQGERIDPAAMHATRLANTAIDRVRERERAVADDIAAFAASDLLCYRAEAPTALRKRQDRAWDPPLQWAERALGSKFAVGVGISPVAQPRDAVARIAAFFAGRDAFQLAALHTMTTLAGSAILVAAHASSAMTLTEIWRAACVDEDWQAERWGEDAEAARRKAFRWAEMEAASAFFADCASG